MDSIQNLLQASAQGDCHTVQHLLDDGVPVDSYDAEEITALQMASACGQDKAICLLLSRGAALDLPNTYGWTPLMHACRQGHTNTVALLLQNKPKVNLRNKLGATALILAIRSGQLSIVRQLIEAGADIHGTDPQHTCEVTQLMIAAQNGFDPLVKILLDRGVDVNYKAPSTGYTALMYAAVNGHKSTVQTLFERGADVNVTNTCDKTALDLACLRHKRTVKDYLENKTKIRITSADEQISQNILEATKNGDFECVRDLLLEDPSQKDAMQVEDGATALMFASMLGRLDLVELLVQIGTNLDTKDSVSGWTALMQAIFHGKSAVAKFLIEAGADVSIKAFNGCSAFDLASLVEDVDADVIRLLAAKTAYLAKESKHVRSNSSGSIPEMLYMDKSNHSKGPKAWWSRMSNHFRHLKLGRKFHLHPMPADCLYARPVRSHSDSSSVVDVEKHHPATWDDEQKNKRSNPTLLLPLNLPSPSLISDSMEPVTPPILPLPSYDPANLHRCKMPPGKINSPHALKVASPDPPLWVNKWWNGSAAGHGLTSGSSANSRNHSPQSSGDSAKLETDLKSFSKLAKQTAAKSNVANNSGITVFVSPYLEDDDKIKVSGSHADALNSLSSPYSFPTSIDISSNSHRKSASSRSSSTRSSKSSSTLTPSISEVGDKSMDSSERGSHGATLQPVEDNDDELSAILKQLSLEKYHPIFEEQEVDIEAFLSLTHQDLVDLGIQPTESRQQLMNAIDKMNTSKNISTQ